MKALYEVPTVHEVGSADVLVQGSKEVGTGDSGTAPLKHDAMTADDEAPEIHEVGAADVVVRGTKPIGNVDNETAPFRQALSGDE
jgi:hypothetical protein